jgi:hypothetical protein
VSERFRGTLASNDVTLENDLDIDTVRYIGPCTQIVINLRNLESQVL